MTLWLILALMTAVAVLAVLLPLVRPVNSIRSGSELAVYRDQLDELERDLNSGLIGKAEADAARVEISRRLISAADATAQPAPRGKPPTRGRHAVAVTALVALPIGATSLYLAIGSPQLPAQPLGARIVPPPARPIDSFVTKLETDLKNDPNNGSRWEEIARAYMQSERFDDATTAWRNALRLLGDNAERQSDLGQSIMAAANGIVTVDAQAAFERAVTLNPNMMIARFFLGVAAEQDGRREDAARIWRNMLAAAPPSASWLGLVRESLTRVESKRPNVTFRPNADNLDAAAKLTPDQQNDLIRGMVDRLATRLKTNDSDLDGWLKLIRAYAILGERDKAKAAASDARHAFVPDQDKLRRIDELVKNLGLEG